MNLSVEEDDGDREGDGGEADGETKVGDPIRRTLQLRVEVVLEDSPRRSSPPELQGWFSPWPDMYNFWFSCPFNFGHSVHCSESVATIEFGNREPSE